MYSAFAETLEHIEKVQLRVAEVNNNLRARAWVHDASKIEPGEEREGYEEVGRVLHNLKFGSEEYNAAREKLLPVIELHFTRNSHHPEHYPNGINDMSLLDIIEMLCDWKAASERDKPNKITFAEALPMHKERFGISDQLYGIIVKTAEELGWT